VKHLRGTEWEEDGPGASYAGYMSKEHIQRGKTTKVGGHKVGTLRSKHFARPRLEESRGDG